jgi:carboxypeptidase Q
MRIHKPFLPAFLILSALLSQDARGQATSSPSLRERYQPVADRLISAALADSSAWNRLALLTDRFGSRISGSQALESAIDWIIAEMKRDGLQNVHGEPVTVSHWVRGAESATLLQPRQQRLHMIGLGLSVGTPAGGITAPVLVVKSFDDLHAHAAEARGKIVLFNVPFAAGDPFAGYGNTVVYRARGAIEAAKVGAVASLIRSVSTASMQNPHTGVMRYDSTVNRIPGAALSVEDAEMLARMQARGEPVLINLTMDESRLPDVTSRNVVAEIRGSTQPDQVVVLGGHIDSWDVGQGAMDDGGGAVAAWEALLLMKRLGLTPKRTVRVVLWTSEETGGIGGIAYAKAHAAEAGSHMLAMESDNGAFKPLGYRVTGSPEAAARIGEIASLMSSIGATKVQTGDPETDVEPLGPLGVPLIGLDVNPDRYFWYHHSEADTMDKLDPKEVAECVAAMAVMAYVVADMPGALPRSVEHP